MSSQCTSRSNKNNNGKNNNKNSTNKKYQLLRNELPTRWGGPRRPHHHCKAPPLADHSPCILSQFYAQGRTHYDLHRWWHGPMRQLLAYWLRLERRTEVVVRTLEGAAESAGTCCCTLLLFMTMVMMLSMALLLSLAMLFMTMIMLLSLAVLLSFGHVHAMIMLLLLLFLVTLLILGIDPLFMVKLSFLCGYTAAIV